MRIAVVHSFYTAQQPSGENNVVLDQVEQLSRAGHDVRLIARHTDDLSDRRLYPVRAALTTATGIGASPEAELTSFCPDVVHLHNTFPNWGTSWLRKWGNRTVMTAHNFRPMCSAGTLFRDGHHCEDCLRIPAVPAVRHGCYRASAVASIPLAVASSPVGSLRRTARAVGRLVTLNERAQATYQTVLRRSVDLVPNFVVPAEGSIRSPRGWAYIGRLTAEKGVDKLVDSWPASEDLEIIGHGPLAERLTQEVATRPNIVVMGMLPREQLLDRLHQYEGLVLPSLWTEGLPTIVLEALARGVPTVVSRHVAASATLEQAGAATVFDPAMGTPEIEAALGRVSRAGGEMRQACVELHEREYSPLTWQQRMQSIYDDVLRAARGHEVA